MLVVVQGFVCGGLRLQLQLMSLVCLWGWNRDSMAGRKLIETQWMINATGLALSFGPQSCLDIQQATKPQT